MPTIHVGTIGQGLWHSSDASTWHKGRGLVEDSVRTLTVSPHNPHTLYAGADHALLRSDDNGASWQPLPSYLADRQTWSLAIHPHDPDILYAGGAPGLRRSLDGGASWTQLSTTIADVTPFDFTTRTTAVLIDSHNPLRLTVGVETDGVHISEDGGETWRRAQPLGPEFFMSDIHSLVRVEDADGGATMTAATPYGAAQSTDDGDAWTYHHFPPLSDAQPQAYCRGLLVKHDDPRTLFLACGDDSPGVTGTVQRSRDGGATWSPCALPPANSMLYWLASHPAEPAFLAAASLHGYVFVSADGGDSWTQLAREFGEIRALAVTP